MTFKENNFWNYPTFEDKDIFFVNNENLKFKEEIVKLRALLDENDTKKITEILHKVLEKKEKIPKENRTGKERKCTKKREKQEKQVENDQEQVLDDNEQVLDDEEQVYYNEEQVVYDEKEEQEILQQKTDFYCNTDGCKKKFNVWGSLVNHINVWIL